MELERLPANPKLATRLRGYADGYDPQIEAKRNSNRGVKLTYRRQGQIKRANKEADRMQGAQVILRALADLYENGGCPLWLGKIKTKKAAHWLAWAVIDFNEYNGGTIPPFGKRFDSEKYFDGEEDYVPAIDWAMDRLAEARDPGLDVQREIDRLTAECELSRPPGYFSTPARVYTDHMFPHIFLPAIGPGHTSTGGGARILEPEAGSGALADGIHERWPEAEIHCIEIVPKLRRILELKGYKLVGTDFLEFIADERLYDAIIMNPPFENGQDIEHVQHAYNQLAPGGTLVSVMSPGPFFRQNGKDKLFRDWFERVGGHVEDLPEGSFLPATGVNSKVVVIHR